ncbi:MAG: TolC family protein [Desulfobulbaceae bacterium]|nr:MAG: TolC family protein [Desulfobulbaceae bacterium]
MKFFPFQKSLGMILVVGALLVSIPPAFATEKVWTPKKAVIFALNHSPDSKIALQRINQSAALLEKNKSFYLPRVDVSAAYSQTDNPMYSFGNILNQGSFDNSIDFNDPGNTDNLGFKAELKYQIYNGGRNGASVDMAESILNSSRISRTETEHLLGYQVVHAFMMILQAQEQQHARKSQLEAINSSLQVAKARYEAGDLLKTDVLNFEVERSSARENVIISEHQLNLANQVFLNLLGLEEESVTIDTTDSFSQNIPNNDSVVTRPKLQALKAQLNAAAAAQKITESKRFPTLDGFANYQLDYSLMDDGSGDSWAAGLRLNYNLYNGNETGAELAMKRAEYQKLKESYEKARLALNLDLEKARINYSQAEQRKQVTQHMVNLAMESAQLSRERFKEGVILASDLIDVEVRLTDALVRQSSANANYQIAIANLRRASGLQQFAPTTAELLENQK